MNENVKSGSINTCLTQPVAIAPKASRVIKNPNTTLKTIRPLLSMCLNKNLLSISCYVFSGESLIVFYRFLQRLQRVKGFFFSDFSKQCNFYGFAIEVFFGIE